MHPDPEQQLVPGETSGKLAAGNQGPLSSYPFSQRPLAALSCGGSLPLQTPNLPSGKGQMTQQDQRLMGLKLFGENDWHFPHGLKSENKGVNL